MSENLEHRDSVKKLSEIELRDITISQLNERVAQKDLELAKLRVDRCKKELTLMSANYTLKNKELEELATQLKKSEESMRELKENNLSRIEGLKKKYQIKNSRWGYDPETGEIKDE